MKNKLDISSNNDLLSFIITKCSDYNYSLGSYDISKENILFKIDNTRKSFDGSVLTGTVIYYKSTFLRCDFPQVTITNYIFIECDLSHMECSEAIFQDSIFIRCDFRHTNFTNCSFRGVYCLIWIKTIKKVKI